MQCMFLMLLSIYFIFFKFFQLCELRTSRRTQFTCIHYQQKVLDHRIEMYLHTKFHRSTNHFQIIHCCRWLWHHFVWFFFCFTSLYFGLAGKNENYLNYVCVFFWCFVAFVRTGQHVMPLVNWKGSREPMFIAKMPASNTMLNVQQRNVDVIKNNINNNDNNDIHNVRVYIFYFSVSYAPCPGNIF